MDRMEGMTDIILSHRVKNLKYHQLTSYNPTKVLYYATYLGIVPVVEWALQRGGKYSNEYNGETVIDLSERMLDQTDAQCHRSIFGLLIDLQFEDELARDFYVD